MTQPSRRPAPSTTDAVFPVRRALVRSGVALRFGLALWPLGARAQDAYPSKPIRVLLGTPPGDAVDSTARELFGRLAPLLGQTLFVENKPGAHGMIVGVAAKTAPKDGYTLLMSSGGPIAINPSLYGDKLPYDPAKDFAPIVQIQRGPAFLAVSPAVPVKNLKEMVAYVKAHEGHVAYGSGGSGTTQHLTMELLKKATGMQMTHAPYRGSPMVLQDLIGGQIQFAFDFGAGVLAQAKSGRVRLIGVASRERSPLVPELPTFAEQGFPGFESYGWSGLFAPAKTPDAVIQKLNRAANEVIRNPEFIAYLRSTSSEPAGGSSEDFRKLVAAETARWGIAVKESGAQPGE